MAKKMTFDLKDNLANEIAKKEDRLEKKEIKLEGGFAIEKKEKKRKPARKTFPIYMDPDLAKRLDKSCKQTGYTRNELINKMIEFCLDNLEVR